MAEPPFTDRALQDAYRELIRDGARGGHLDEPTWDGIATGEIDASARDRAFDHVVQCAECSRIWRGILELKKDAETQGLIPAGAPPSTAFWRSWAPYAIAASLVLAVGSVVLYQRSPGSAVNQRVVNRGAALPEITGTSYAGASKTFSWTPVQGASQYRISVFTRDGLPVFTSTVASASAPWAERVAAPPGSYTWQVEDLTSAGVIARSRVVDVDVTR